MSKKKKIGIVVFFVVLILLVIIAVIQNGQSKEADNITYETITVAEQEPLLADGKVVPENTSEYTYDPQNGEITSISVEDKALVESGDELFRYDNASVNDQIDDLKTNRDRLNRSLKDKNEELKDLKNAPTGGPSPSAQTDGASLTGGYESVQTNEASIQATEATISDLENQISDLDTQISRLEKQATKIITADVGGTVQLDESLKDNATVPFLRIITDDTLIQSSISEYDYYAVSEDLKVGIYINAEDREVEGVITSVDGTTQSSANLGSMETGSLTGGTSSVIDMSNFEFFVRPEEEIHYDFTVQIQIPLKDFVIPESAIQKDKEQEYVYVVKDGKAKKQAIQREKRGLQNVVVQGLKLKDVVITNPNGQLKDGMDILIATEGESSDQ